MTIFSVIIALVIFGIILWIVNIYIPMDGEIKTILNVVAVIMVVACLLNVFGIVDSMAEVLPGNWHMRE